MFFWKINKPPPLKKYSFESVFHHFPVKIATTRRNRGYSLLLQKKLFKCTLVGRQQYSAQGKINLTSEQ